MAMALEPFFLTPPPAPRHLAELRIEPAHSAIAFSAPCAGDAGRKRRCLLPSSSVRKRMLLELAPFDPAPCAPPPPPPTPSPTPPPSPMASHAGSSTAAEFSFAPGLRPILPTTAAGNMFGFAENAPTTPGRSEASGAGNMFAFLAAPERPNTPTGPTSRGGFVFAASPEGPLTPTSRGSNTSGLSLLASQNQPLTPTGPIASGRQPSLMPNGSGGASASLLSPKPARTGAADSGGFAVVPSGPAWAPIGSTSSAVAKETTLPTVGLPTPSFVFSASRSPPRPRGEIKKRRRPNLRIETVPRRMSPRQWEEETTPTPQQLTPPPHKLAKTNSSDNGEASRSGIMSGPCCLFVTSPANAAKQEAKKAPSEASRSPAGSRCTSPSKRYFLEKPSKPTSTRSGGRGGSVQRILLRG
ncbi:hypothetical protein PVAP13_9NG355300 [Panicum virgatum]|uniref:Uncharacterized protein n=1 Tax=Panicum virgatum TaxID=38727 RepID=A0A8T0MLX4_PANVG|nr:hypothetical protein PVAP13_9NG355300 [Panicum virgatum]